MTRSGGGVGGRGIARSPVRPHALRPHDRPQQIIHRVHDAEVGAHVHGGRTGEGRRAKGGGRKKGLGLRVRSFPSFALRPSPFALRPPLHPPVERLPTRLGVQHPPGDVEGGFRERVPFKERQARLQLLAAADFLAQEGAALVGIDSCNIDNMHVRARPVHTRLLGADIPICEHMTGLGRLPDEGFTFSAVPPKIRGMGSFPVRAYAVLG